MNDTVTILKKWLPPLTDKNRSFASEFVDCIQLDGPLIEMFMTNIHKLNNETVLKEGPLTTGAGCFFGGIGFCYCQCYELRNLDVLFAFTSLYMIVDHYLDDKHIDNNDKSQFMIIVQKVLSGEEITGDKTLMLLIEQFNYIIDRVPSCKYYLYRAIYVEMQSVAIQKKDDLSYDEYYHIAAEKGGTTVQAIQAMYELPVTQKEYNLGVCIQLVDDIMDIEDDIGNNIHTIATYIYNKNGSLDELVHTTCNMINNLSSTYNAFKTILLAVLCHSISSKQGTFFSDDVVQACQEYVATKSDVVIRSMFHNRLLKAYYHTILTQ